jgi:DeoR/GlpR family transcriptional regulator of sugar metabolism
LVKVVTTMQVLRREKLKSILEERKSVTIADLVLELKVSEMTIHRDLDRLQGEGFLIKTWGGALLNRPGIAGEAANYSYNAVKNTLIEEKQAIAREALKLISDRESLIFDNSTTAFELAKILDGFTQLTVMATNPEVFDALKAVNGITLYSTGGLYSPQTNSFVGATAEDFVSRRSISTCIIGALGVSLEEGVTDPYPSEASLKRKIVSCSDRVILLVDHMKFNRIATEKVAALDQIDCLITDWAVDPELVRQFSARTKVIVCKRIVDAKRPAPSAAEGQG